MTVAQTKTLATHLVSGELPLMMTLVRVEQVTPTSTALQRGAPGAGSQDWRGPSMARNAPGV
jgi:hypothetical protein